MKKLSPYYEETTDGYRRLTYKEVVEDLQKYASEMEDKYILEKNKNDKVIEYCKELMLFKKNSRQYLIGKCMLENLRGDDKE